MLDKKIKVDDLEGYNPVMRAAYRFSFPDGLTLRELRDTEICWLRSIYTYCINKER